MTRQEIKELAIINFGLENPYTIAIFQADETCKDDKVAIPWMIRLLEMGMGMA